jgi:hypothetical protein
MVATVKSNGKVMAFDQDEEEQSAQIKIDKIGTILARIPIVGTSPLIVHRFGEKAKKQMLDATQGRKTPKEPKNPQAEYEEAFYKFADGGYGMPASAFRQATIGAARFYGKNQVTMTGLKQFLFVRGEVGLDGQGLVRINGEPSMREDPVRVGRGGADLRYRPEFRQWTATLDVLFVSSALTRSSVVSLVEAGGLGVGVGEWRPEKSGDFGCYKIDQTREVTFEVTL